MNKKIIIAGGRDFDDYELLRAEVSKIISSFEQTEIEIVNGGAKGADELGERFATENKYDSVTFIANWKNLELTPCIVGHNAYGAYNKLAGHNRNIEMAEYADVLIAFWNGKSTGTKHMINTAKGKGLDVYIIKY